MSGGTLVGDILCPVLVVIHLIWDWKNRGFRGFVQQILGALCVGIVVNAIVNAKFYDTSRVATLIIFYGLLAVLFYWWAWRSRHTNRN